MLFVDERGSVLEANRGAMLLLGIGKSDLRRLDLCAIFSTLSEEECRDTLRAAAAGRYTNELWCTRADGTRFRGEVLLMPASHGELVLVLRDASRRHDELERERRRMRQSIAVSAFAQRATRELTVEAVAVAAVEHVAAAMHADYVELAEGGQGESLVVTQTFGGRGAGEHVTIDPAPGTIHSVALAQREPVLRELTDRDLDAAPHLRERGMRWGALLALRVRDRTCLLGAFSQSALSEEDLYPLRSIGALAENIAARRVAEAQLAERDRTLTMILDQLPAILTTIDRDLRFIEVRGAGLRAVGGLPNDLAGHPVTDVIRPGSPAAQVWRAALEGRSGSFSADWGDRFYDNHVEPLRDPSGEVVGVMNLGVDVTERVRSEEELRRLSARLNKLQEEERRRIAHELHDELGQRLTALRIEASLLPHKLGRRRTAAASDAIASMVDLIDETIATVRRVSTELRPPILDDVGFRAALEIELAALQKRSGIGFEIRFTPDDLQLGREDATTLYRIVQESLTNVVRHAQATFVRVSLERRDGTIVLEIADDGRGITREELASTSSIGLIGIRERAYAHGGRADIRAREGGGTVVSVWLPAGDVT